VPDVARLLQAFVSPSIFISAGALLMLSLNVRLMGIVARMRQFHREKHVAAQEGKLQEAQAIADQIVSIEQRAERIRKACLFVLVALAGTIGTCMLLGLALFWPAAEPFAAVLLTLSIFSLFIGTMYYVTEISVALSSVREEAKHFHLIDIVVLSRIDPRAAADERGQH
jgi:amino acid permease